MPDPAVSSTDAELRAHVGRALDAHYELDREIGRGGMGIVYRAKDRRLKRVVAIKILPPELAFRSEIRTRFLREAETAAQLNHPNIVDIYSVDESEGLVYFVMAYIPGDNLAKKLHDRGPMDVGETREVLCQVADALAYAHERGVIHRDIKPDNILLDQSGRPLVTDFGIARAITEGDSRLTATGVAVGTPAYMSPEQAAGDREIDGRSDLYSLGVVAYQMLCGQPPFTATSTPAILVKHVSERPVPIEQRRPDVPLDLARIVMTMLEKDPEARFPSSEAVIAALKTGRIDESGPGAPRRPAAAPVAAPPAPPVGLSASVTYGGNVPASAEEMQRWSAPKVEAYRRSMTKYIYVNAVIILGAPWINLLFWTVIHSIVMAFKYAKLVSDGFDWHDVFRQPRHREIIDVVEDTATYMRAVVDKNERARMREERRARLSGAHVAQSQLPPGNGPSKVAIAAAGPYGDRVQRAHAERDEILRIVSRMSAADRAAIPDVEHSANALASKVEALAFSLVEHERGNDVQSAEAIESEISRLEGEANPLEHARSEERVRRLAFLKRQRRAVADTMSRRTTIAAKLDTCLSALESMRLDVLRLSTGSGTAQRVTTLAMEALSLAESVDSALYVADEMGRMSATRSTRPAG